MFFQHLVEGFEDQNIGTFRQIKKLSLLLAGNLDGEVVGQTLTNISNRGRLWNVSEDFVQIFCVLKKIFKLVYGEGHFEKINAQQMVSKLMKNPVVISHFSVLYSDTIYKNNCCCFMLGSDPFPMPKAKFRSTRLRTKKPSNVLSELQWSNHLQQKIKNTDDLDRFKRLFL